MYTCMTATTYTYMHVHAYMYNKHTRQGTFVTVAMINIIDQSISISISLMPNCRFV